jgi:hypothetical protein
MRRPKYTTMTALLFLLSGLSVAQGVDRKLTKDDYWAFSIENKSDVSVFVTVDDRNLGDKNLFHDNISAGRKVFVNNKAVNISPDGKIRKVFLRWKVEGPGQKFCGEVKLKDDNSAFQIGLKPSFGGKPC